jgi:hypothetical protein
MRRTVRNDLTAVASQYGKLSISLANPQVGLRQILARAQDKNTLGYRFVLRIGPFVPLQLQINAHFARPTQSPDSSRVAIKARYECAPDDKLRDTHQLHLMETMGFAGSTHPMYYARGSAATI